MRKVEELAPGLAVSAGIALASWLIGRQLPLIGGPIVAILLGMAIALVWKAKGRAQAGISFTSKYVLQTAVVLLGFGLDLGVVARTGWMSLPIIVVTISTALILAWAMSRVLHMASNTATLIGVGSSICGGSAIAATAPVIKASDDEVAQSISVIFLFNVLAALLFPLLGHALGMSTTSGEVFGIFAGTAVNDTSSVTAAASTWDTMWHLGSATLDTAVTVKLTRTLAIIPITLALAFLRRDAGTFSVKRAFPKFLAWFILGSILTSLLLSFGVSPAVFVPLKELSKFFVIMAMAAVGLNSNVIQLVKTGGKPLALGAACWAGITVVAVVLMEGLGIL
ncbi:AraC family transcriptional regulator [Alloscardovia macacae]|uniref:AraC family transcriptional regulator n=1 Tax=Alloscardovia macacae TaxID=1160091 RepID=A0A1Y2SUY3_9BIFI|nr:YeiH family protein [Alloscardovia macacae]OTA25895.1 AraC family transcriptional regulator [Alloscardovia macacae]OTA28288.1 AraC family transcriptional regulator [Alloscardovia macacae]